MSANNRINRWSNSVRWGIKMCSVCFYTGQVVCPQGSGGTELTGDKPAPESFNQSSLKSMLVISGGEGYIDFRMGKKY